MESMQANVEMSVQQENWKEAAKGASNLSELQLTLGDLTEALSSAAQSVAYADKSGELFHRMSKCTTHADVLHQVGQVAQARELFQVAEALQQERQSGYPRLYSLGGFRYCDLLLVQGETAAVLERSESALEVAKRNGWLLGIALDQLSLGRAHLQQAVEETPPSLPVSGEEQEHAARSLSEAKGWLEQAVAGLRAAGAQHHLPRGLLARAAFFRYAHDVARARQDLQEVFEIAEPSGMRLFLTDYHLEMARLMLAEQEEGVCNTPLQGTDVGGYCIRPLALHEHIATAERLITATGYHRRDPELAELQQHLATGATP
jgi:tetratricopeptide (TPR) repeat protein